MKNAQGTVVAESPQGTYSTAYSHEYASLELGDGQYIIEVTDGQGDGQGDGLCCKFGTGSFEVTDSNGDFIMNVREFGTSVSTSFSIAGGVVSVGNMVFVPPTRAVVTYTEPNACVEGKAKCSATEVCCNGSGLTEPPTAICSSLTLITMKLTTDSYPLETTWDISDSNGISRLSGDSQTRNDVDIESVALEDGTYTATVMDNYGDGICCSYGEGSFVVTAEVTDSDEKAIMNVREFQSSVTTTFTIDNGVVTVVGVSSVP